MSQLTVVETVVEAGRSGGGALPVAAAVNLGLWMMIEGYGLAFGDWVGRLPVTI